jgi:hypothetical protein
MVLAALPVHAQWIQVDLCTNPSNCQPVVSGTVLADQWRPIGILFDARPAEVDPIMAVFGGDTCHLFFSPDQYGVTAVFSFVQPGTALATDAVGFSLAAWYSPGESAQLVGLDEFDNVVAQAEITSADIGSSSQTLEMSILGSFRAVEWRTQGNPGIAASSLRFLSQDAASIPGVSGWGALILGALLAGGALLLLRR